MLSKMRALLKPLAVHTAYSPIETIVFFSVIATLAYFHVLNAIKHSAFLDAPFPPVTLLPSYVSLKQSSWEPVRESRWLEQKDASNSVSLIQILYSLQDAKEGVNLATAPISTALQNASSHITSLSDLPGPEASPSHCYRLTPSSQCFTSFWTTPRIATQNLVSSPSVDAETYLNAFQSYFSSLESDDGVSFAMERTSVQDDHSLSGMRSSYWAAYAMRALFHRFYSLAQKADSLDIILILMGYVLMHYTFALLFIRSRSLCASSFWLPMSILTSSVLALLITLPMAMKFGIKMDIVALTEAIPFIICTVGFDKPLRLARAVFGHEHLLKAPTKNGPLKPAGRVILDSLDAVYQPILRDYILEIAVLASGATSTVSGLREVCAFAGILLAVDCLLMCTFLSSILTIMVEVRRIQAARDFSQKKSRPQKDLATGRMRSAMSRSSSPPVEQGLGGRLSAAVLGVKESKTYGFKEDQEENPVAKLKLLLIASFTILHVLNFITPLTTPLTPNVATREQVTEFRRVDVREESIRSVLTSLAEFTFSAASEDTPKELLVKVSPPIHAYIIPPSSMQSQASQRSVISLAATLSGGSAGSWLDRFASSWTAFVGDPVMSKWIVVALAISISLNGYLLNGIASGMAGIRSSTSSAVRFKGTEGAEHEDKETKKEATPRFQAQSTPTTPRPAIAARQFTAPSTDRFATSRLPMTSTVESGGLEIQAPAPQVPAATFTLDDVDRKLQAQAVTGKFTVHTPITPATPGSLIQQPNHVPPGTKVLVRSLEECIDILDEEGQIGLKRLNDEEVILLAQNGKIAAYALEKVLGNDQLERAVRIRRALISRASITQTLETSDIPLSNYDYSRVMGACCENVVGYIPLPFGIAGPLKIDGILCPIPMATAEGTLVASTSRGCKALNAGGGVTTVLTQDAMTRGPAIDFPSVVEAAQAKAWIDSEIGYNTIKTAFESTSRFAKLRSLKTAMAGRTLFVRFATATGDAMGMNMISKGTEKALDAMQQEFPDMIILTLSGNYCTDKKPAAINWIEGRGKSVVVEAVVPGKTVKSVLKTTVEALCNLNIKKNLVGSAMAGSIGGFNAHAANILTAIFLATGQDPAQNVESSNCMTLMEPTNNGQDLLITVSMPSIEVGTVGGGTVLAPQGAVLEMLGIKGAHPTSPGKNAQNLARIIASAVMAAELSLMSALAAGHLVRAHLVHNRSQTNTPSTSAPPTPGPDSQPVILVQSEKDVKDAKEEPSTSGSSSPKESLPPYTQTAQ